MKWRLIAVASIVPLMLLAAGSRAASVIQELPLSFKLPGSFTVGSRYAFDFSLYDTPNTASPAAPLWQETQAYRIPGSRKITHRLGSVVPFSDATPPLDFGSQLWVEVRRGSKLVGGRRIQLGPVVPYALYAESGAGGSVTGTMILDGSVGAEDLQDGAALAEILDNDGPSSGLDADLLDGLHAADLAAAGHGHSGADIASGTVGNGFFSAYSDLAGEGYLDNNASTDLLTQTQADGRYVPYASGNATVTGNYNYSSTKTYKRSYPGVSFNPGPGSITTGSPSDIQKYSQGGFIFSNLTGSQTNYYASAPITEIPNGATITAMTCYRYDNDALYNMASYHSIHTRSLTSTVYSESHNIASSTISGTSTAVRASATGTGSLTIDYAANNYSIYSYFSMFGGSKDIRFYGCVVTYTMSSVSN